MERSHKGSLHFHIRRRLDESACPEMPRGPVLDLFSFDAHEDTEPSLS